MVDVLPRVHSWKERHGIYRYIALLTYLPYLDNVTAVNWWVGLPGMNEIAKRARLYLFLGSTSKFWIRKATNTFCVLKSLHNCRSDLVLLAVGVMPACSNRRLIKLQDAIQVTSYHECREMAFIDRQ